MTDSYPAMVRSRGSDHRLHSLLIPGCWLSIALLVVLGACGVKDPDTPGNAVLGYITAEQLGEPDAESLLCEGLRGEGSDSEREDAALLAETATSFYTGVDRVSGGEAVVLLEVRIPVPGSRTFEVTTEDWQVVVVKEDGGWKPCEFRRAVGPSGEE